MAHSAINKQVRIYLDLGRDELGRNKHPITVEDTKGYVNVY